MTIEVAIAFIIALFAFNSSVVTALVGVVVYLALRMGRFPTRLEFNELRGELKADMAQFRQEYREEMAQFRQEIREEMAQFRQELRDDFHRSHQQLLLALAGHSHRDDGQAVFTVPAELDPTPTPADD